MAPHGSESVVALMVGDWSAGSQFVSRGGRSVPRCDECLLCKSLAGGGEADGSHFCAPAVIGSECQNLHKGTRTHAFSEPPSDEPAPRWSLRRVMSSGGGHGHSYGNASAGAGAASWDSLNYLDVLKEVYSSLVRGPPVCVLFCQSKPPHLQRIYSGLTPNTHMHMHRASLAACPTPPWPPGPAAEVRARIRVWASEC